jgi:hypothetical protein
MQVTDLSRVSWQCIHFTRRDTLASLQGRLLEQGIIPATVDPAQISSEEELLSAVAEALRFPDYFGGNWDALDDCLRDMNWLPSAGCVLFVLGAQRLWSSHGPQAGQLVESWLLAAEFWSQQSIPLHLVFVW